jgi:DNA-directed RNA polymerase subunit M/transcription elongation factor TFIIS
MQFCKECDNKLFPHEEENILWNKCLDCGFKEKYESSVIEKKVFKTISNQSRDNNMYLIHDCTLPRTNQKQCPNKSCISVKNPALQEVIFIQDPVSVKLTYICVNCNIEWKYS